MVRSIDAIEKRVQRLLEKQEIKHAKERAKEEERLAREKSIKAITAAQIIERFAAMGVGVSRPQFLFGLVHCLEEGEKQTLQDLINTPGPLVNPSRGSNVAAPPIMPVSPIRSKRQRPISSREIGERFQGMSNRAKLVFEMSKCLSRREKQTLQALVDSALRASAMGSFSNKPAPT